MPFVTGTANSFADLLAAVQAACTANGYTLTGNVLSKGTLFAEITSIAQTYPVLAVRCGTGQSGGVLSGASDMASAALGFVTTGGLGSNAFAFPMTYDVHIGTVPDEVYLLVNYGVNLYQYIAFGQSSVLGLTGSGNWYAGSCGTGNWITQNIHIYTTGGGNVADNRGVINPGLFQGSDPASQNAAVDHKLDTATWGVEGAWRDAWSLLPNSPSSWNGEAILQPVTVYAPRPSGFVSAVAELAHARFVSIDNLTDQQIITLGSDRWKIYPWWKRGVRGMPPAGIDSATLGHAIRYDGP